MTEFGDRIKTYRTKNSLTQPDACSRLFPKAHGHSSPNAKAVYVSGLESGRNTMGETAPDFQNVMRLLGVDETTLLKMLHADHRAMRKNARSPSAVNGVANGASVESASRALDAKLDELQGLTSTVKKAVVKKTPTPVAKAVSSFDPQTTAALRDMQHERLSIAARPRGDKYKKVVKVPSTPSAPVTGGASGLESLVADLSYVIQRHMASPLRDMHHQTLADFTRRVAVAAVVVGNDVSGDVGALAEDLCHVMQLRSQSEQVRALPPKPLRDFVRRVVKSAIRLQEVQ